MCFHSKYKTRQLAKEFDAELLGYRVFSKCDETVVYETELNGIKIGILGWCTGGGPLVASLVEELSVIGVEYIIGIGAAASIDKSVFIQDLILATELLVNDGTSKCYIEDKPVIHINPEMRKMFLDICKERKQPVKEVKAATVEALYRQNEALLQAWRNQDCQIVNWELTPFYASCKVCDIKCLWYGHISDVEIDGIWNDWYCNRIQVFQDSINLCKSILSYLVKEILI